MHMDPIDISSSDSEGEILQLTRNGMSFQMLPSASVVPRKLPTWASPLNLNSNIVVQHSTSTSLLRNNNDIINDKASNQHGSEFTLREESIQENTERASAASSNVVNSKYLPESSINHIPVIEIRTSAPSTSFQMTQGKLGPSLEHEINKQLDFTKTFDGNDEWGVEYSHFESPEHFMSENMAKSILPHSCQTPISISEKQIEGCNQYAHGNDTNILVSEKKHVIEENDDDVMIYESFSPRRHLPSSLVHGKSATNLKPVGSIAAPYHSRIVEDGPIQNDERLIFQTAVQDLSQPRLEADVPDGLLNVALLRHQKIALAWMLQKETTVFPCLGGILADDQGLGKTISTIALIQMQMSLQSKHISGTPHVVETEPFNLEEDDGSILESNGLKKTTDEDILNNHTISDTKKNFCKGRPTAGTLVVCPTSVLWQWARELDEKITNAAKLSVLIYHGNRTKDPCELTTYDVVLTTYSIVTNEVPKQPLVDDDDADRKAEKYGLYSDFIGRKKKECNEGKKRKKNRKGNDGLPVDPDSGPLAKVGWFRVVLDEAQTIKNHRTLVARACSTLRAKRRWCLSGTPIQNTIDDLYSYFRFLRYDPYSVYKCFCLSIKYPITRNSACGYKKLQAILKTIMLRRTKETIIDGESIIKLPKKSIYLKKVDFTEEERTFYTRLEADSRSQFKKYAAEGTVTQNYANILLMLLRLRQACDHPLLVKDCLSHSVGRASLTMAKRLSREKLSSLLNELEGSLPICSVCNDPPEDAIVTICGHVFCYQCVSEYLTGDVTICPSSSCKEQLGTDLVFSKTILRNCIYDVDGDHATNAFGDTEGLNRVSPFTTSSKIRAVMEILQSLHKINSQSSNLYFGGHNKECNSISDNFLLNVHDKKGINENQRNIMPEKAIVFSQWTGMLDLVESSLNNSFIQYRRLDGTMSLASRDKAVKDFTNNPQVTVMIMSLKAGNLGLNLVSANHVILLDLWWNPTTEDQAVDRAHRIGQTRPVTVSRLTIKDTVEDRILALQEEKRKMVSSAFGEDQSGNIATRLTVDDLRYLFMV